jgi:hypothetical protein
MPLPVEETSALLLREYINALVVNIKMPIPATQINLVFDSGAFNGAFALGVALYIKSLEKHGFLKIQKVSGCSIGSLIAVWYLRGCPEDLFDFFLPVMQKFKTDWKLNEYKRQITGYIDILIPTESALEALNGKLFINYIKNYTPVVVSHFRNKAHLLTCILRSSFIPYLSNRKLQYQKKYMDGGIPYIFPPSRTETLFISLYTFARIKQMFSFKNEQNIHYRLLAGVADANEFFIKGKSDMCSYVNYWQHLWLKFRQIVFLLCVYLFHGILYCKKKMPTFCKQILGYLCCLE